MKELPPITQKFILHWGEMGVRWGINRTLAQIHALLFLSEEPLNAEQICQQLQLARSNVSVALKELQNWGIIKLVHLPGDRRDHFESLKDVFEMFRIILNERRHREIDPTLDLINRCLDENSKPKSEDSHARAQLLSLKEFFELALHFSAQIDRLNTKTLVRAARMSDKVLKLLEKL